MPTDFNGFSYSLLDLPSNTEAQAVSKPRKVYTEAADSTIFELEQDYMVLIDQYEPLAPSTPHPTMAGVIYCKDSPIQDVGTGMGRFTRRWTVIPGFDELGKKTQYVSLDWESYVFQVPGIDNTQGVFLLNNASGGSISGNNYVITTVDAHDLAVDDYVFFDYAVYDPVDKGELRRHILTKCLTGTAGSTVVVANPKDISAITPLAVYKASTYQLSYQKNVTSKIVKDYWLVGYNIDAVENIPLLQPFEIIDKATGARTEFLSDHSAPTYDEYMTAVDGGKWLVAEASILRRWKDSAIMERATRYVRYQL